MAGDEIFALEQDGRNWSAYRKMLLHEADVEGLRGLFDGTEAQPLDERGTDSLWDQQNAQAMCLFAMTIPDSLFLRISHFDTALEALLYLQSLFEKTTTTTTTVHDDDTTCTAARARKTFGGTCRKCGEVGHKARECARVENRLEKPTVEKSDHARRCERKRGTENLKRVQSQPPEGQSGATSHVRTPPSEDASDGEAQGATGEEVEGGEMDDDEPRRAHERIDDEDSRVEMSEDKTTTATPGAPPSMPLEGEWIEKASGGSSEPTAHEMTSASARGASHDHPAEDAAPMNPDEDAGQTDSPRPPEDPGDATDDDSRHPDEPTEPPDDAESARVRGGEGRVEADVERSSRGRADETVGSDSAMGARTESRNDEGVPGSSKDDPEDPGGATDRRDVVEVEPGGETMGRRSGRVADESADAEVDEEVGGARRDAQVDGESAGTCRASEREGKSASVHSRTTDEENDQCPPTDDDDIPGIAPAPPEPPDGTAKPQDESPSAELEGKWRLVASYEVGPTSAEADMPGVSKGDEDPRNRPKGAQNASERARERSKRRPRKHLPEGGRNDRGDPSGEAYASGASGRIEDVWKRPRELQSASKRVGERSKKKVEEDSPERPRGEPDEPGGETVVPGGVHNVQESPRKVRDERADGTNAPSRDTGPGGRLELQGDSRGVEVDPDRREVVEGTEHDGKRPRSEEDERYVETNALCRVRWPGGHVDEEDESGDVEGDRERRNDGDGIEMDVEWCRTDSATSGAHRDLKRVGSRPLAGVEASQHGRRRRTTAHVPEPSTLPPEHHRRPTDYANPPRRRGRIKTKPRRVSQAGSRKSTHHVVRPRQGYIGRVGCVVYLVYGPGMAQERSRGAQRKDEAIGVDRGQPRIHRESKDLAKPRLAISGNRSSAARRCYLE